MLCLASVKKHAFSLQAAGHWSLALQINPQHPDGWFALGYCYLKLQEDQQAIQAFTKTAQQQPENGDAWNNIAAICLRVGLSHSLLIKWYTPWRRS